MGAIIRRKVDQLNKIKWVLSLWRVRATIEKQRFVYTHLKFNIGTIEMLPNILFWSIFNIRSTGMLGEKCNQLYYGGNLQVNCPSLEIMDLILT